MGAVYRPLIQELPDKPEASYKWTDIVWLVVALFYVFWIACRQEPNSWSIAAMILSFCVPQFLCGKFQSEQKPQKSVQSIIGMNRLLTVICWIVAIGVIGVAILAGLGVPPMSEILDAWPVPIFVSQTIAFCYGFMALAGIVFIPVFRVATFIEKRMWLCWVWAFAASAIALAIVRYK
jgi:hypothetical protein